MPEFDPYYRWLGIAPKDQPPNHYRLLGIDLFEEDRQVIAVAAKKQAKHLRTFKTVSNAPTVQKLLGAVNVAFSCLTNPTEKQSYDDELRKMLAPKANVPVAETIDSELAASGASPIVKRREKKPSGFPLPSVVAIIAVVAGIVALGLLLIFSQPDKPSEKQTAVAGAPKAEDSAAGPRESANSVPRPLTPRPSTSAASAVVLDVAGSKKELTAAEPKTTGSQLSHAKTDNSDVVPPAMPDTSPKATTAASHISASKAEPPVSTEPTSDPSFAERAPPSEENTTARLASPSAEQQKKLIAEMDEIYEPGDIKDQAAKTALARKLFEEGQKDGGNRAEQFVFLRRAAEIARDANEVELMLQAIDAIAARFDVRPFQVKARFLKQLLTKGTPTSASQVLAINAACVSFVEAAVADEATGEASEVLDAAGKFLAKLLLQSQAAQRAAKSAVLRARSPTEKAEREKAAADAEEELDSIKTAQHALAECAKTSQQALAHEIVRSAQAQLEKDPEDATACLTVGRWYCFDRGNWDEGLKLDC